MSRRMVRDLILQRPLSDISNHRRNEGGAGEGSEGFLDVDRQL